MALLVPPASFSVLWALWCPVFRLGKGKLESGDSGKPVTPFYSEDVVARQGLCEFDAYARIILTRATNRGSCARVTSMRLGPYAAIAGSSALAPLATRSLS